MSFNLFNSALSDIFVLIMVTFNLPKTRLALLLVVEMTDTSVSVSFSHIGICLLKI